MRLLSRKWNSLVILFVFSEVDWMYTLEQGRAEPWSKPVDQLMKASKVQPQLPPELPDCEGSWARQLGRRQLQLRRQPDSDGSCQLRCSRRVGVKSSSPRWVTPTDSPSRHSSNWKMFRHLLNYGDLFWWNWSYSTVSTNKRGIRYFLTFDKAERECGNSHG